jgi:hypothetical protein
MSAAHPYAHNTYIARFAVAVHKYTQSTSGSITSWQRTVAHNQAVGGVPDSAHLLGLAVDVVYDDGGDYMTGPARLARDVTAGELGLGIFHERDHDHVFLTGFGWPN